MKNATVKTRDVVVSVFAVLMLIMHSYWKIAVKPMRECVVNVKRVGDQIVVVLPKEFVAAEQLSEGTLVRVTVQKIQKQILALPKKEDSLGVDDPWRLLE